MQDIKTKTRCIKHVSRHSCLDNGIWLLVWITFVIVCSWNKDCLLRSSPLSLPATPCDRMTDRKSMDLAAVSLFSLCLGDQAIDDFVKDFCGLLWNSLLL